MMTEKEKAAYILGLKYAIDQIEEEGDCIWVEYSSQPLLLAAAEETLRNASQLIQDEIAMTDGTRETQGK